MLNREVSEQDVKDILAFIYSGKVSLPRARLPAFLKAAEALKIKGLAYSDSGGGTAPTTTAKKRSEALSTASKASSVKENVSAGSKRPAPPATIRLSNASDGAASESEQQSGTMSNQQPFLMGNIQNTLVHGRPIPVILHT